MWMYFSKLLLCAVVINNIDIKVLVALKCVRTPPEGISTNQSPYDGRFKLRVLGEPDRYIPEENYTSTYNFYLCL